MMFFTGDGSVEFFVDFPMLCINAAITDYFVMLFKDMADQTFYESHNRKRFFHIFVIFMPVVMESDKVAIIFIDPGGGDNGTAKIASDVFDGCFGFAIDWSGIHVGTFLMFLISQSVDLF